MAAASADNAGFRTAVIAALPRLRRFCQGLAGNAQDGDDLMQATVERALSRADQFEPGTRIESWMFRIAQNLRIDAARSAQRRGHHMPIEDMPDAAGEDGRTTVENRSDLAAAQRALQAVPEDQRAAFLLVVVEGMSYREAAETLDVPVGTIMSRLARARLRIEQVVGRSTGNESIGKRSGGASNKNAESSHSSELSSSGCGASSGPGASTGSRRPTTTRRVSSTPSSARPARAAPTPSPSTGPVV